MTDNEHYGTVDGVEVEPSVTPSIVSHASPDGTKEAITTCISSSAEEADASSVAPISTEEAILLAAESEFMSKGFAGARTTSIAKAAGVTHSMLHYYFRTKEALFERIVQEKAAEMGRVIINALDNEALSFTEKVVTVLREHFEFIKKNPMLPAFLLAEANKESGVMEVFKKNVQRTALPMLAKTIEQFNEEIKSGRICDIDITALLVDILSLNVVSVAMATIMSAILGMDRESFLEERLNENIETITRRIRPSGSNETIV